MSEPQEKILAFDNQFHEFGTQEVVGVDCVATPFPFITETDNLVSLNLTQVELRELLSSIQVGAEWTYPDKSHQILFNFMKGLICPPELQPDAACTKYSPTSSFVHYQPNNPDDTEAPPGYLFPAWVRFGEFDSIFPDWINDWVQGIIEDLTGYQATDVLCNIASFPANTIEAFLSGGGILPSFQVYCSGTGTIELEILSFPLGGRCIVELDEAPNLVDILTGGILDPNAIIIDTNRDIFSYPPEENVASTIKFEVTEPGDHILYVVFVPTINDSLDFLGLGGGIRSVELCGFEEVTVMGIESIVWDGCELKYTVNAVETVVVTAAEIQACLDFSGITGARAEELDLNILGDYLVPSLLASNSTSFVDADATNIKQAFTNIDAGKVVAAFYLPHVSKGVAGTGTFRLILDTTASLEEIEVAFAATAQQGIWLLGVWDNVAEGSHTVKVQYKSSNANNVRIEANHSITWQVQVFTPAETAFIQDIRIFGGELQKKIGGVWYDVVDSFADIIAGLQADINAAQVTANNAVTTANNAATTAAAANVKAQQAIDENDIQDLRLNVLEDSQAAQDLLISGLQDCCDENSAAIAGLDARVTILEQSAIDLQNEIDALGIWSQDFVFVSGMQGWNSSGDWDSGVGFIVGTPDVTLNYPFTTIEGSAVDKILVKVQSITTGERVLSMSMNGDDDTPLQLPVNGSSLNNIHRVSNSPASYQISLHFDGTAGGAGGDYAIVAIVVYGSGENPF